MGLMAGNAILLKVADNVRPVGRLINEILESAKLPKALFHHIEDRGTKVSSEFFKHGIDKIFFTGSVAVGKDYGCRFRDFNSSFSRARRK